MRRSVLVSVAAVTAWAASVALAFAQAAAPAPGAAASRAVPRAAVPAYLVIDLQTGRRLAIRRENVLRTAVPPGSIAKIATLMAALDARVVTPGATFVCGRRTAVEGETVTCSHPSLGRPLTLAEAVAHSCNSAFASIASRLRREDFDRALGALGLPPSDPTVPVAIAGLGLRGVRATPAQLLNALVRAVLPLPPSAPAPGAGRAMDESRRVLLEGLRGSADYGTAAVIAAHGVTAFAKTGTAPMPGGRYMGLVVAIAPADHPTVGVVVVAPGAAGMDAAGVAADRLQEALARPAPQKAEPVVEVQLRIGRTKPSGRYEVETIGLEEYVARVVAAEAGPGAGPEAREALAVVARTYALANRDRHRGEGFDLCDLTHCQAVGRATSASRRSAEATRGQVLRYGANVASVYYTASCGGQSERPGQVWKGAADMPYLPSHSEDECRAASRWTSEIAAAGLVRALRVAGMKGQEIRNLWVRSRSATGRAARIAVTGFEPAEIDGEAFRLAVGRTLGWHLLKSTDFNVTRTASGYRFDGHGAGHGVGLCVMGATRQARAGAKAEAILAAYFPGTSLGAIALPEPRVDVTVPAGAERERTVVVDLVRRTLKDYATRLSVPAPSTVTLVFHPTVESYLRATGQPWWTAAATQGHKVDLLPPSVLRQRGTFERTLRHEIAHVITAERLRDRPFWVREAAAMYVSNEIPLSKDDAVEQAASDGLRRTCPSDEEMRRFASADAMREAYARAAACYAEQLASGKRWDEIR
jgi:SpoIID/LytB domain protein